MDPGIFRFGQFSLDARSGLLTLEGVPVKLEKIPADLLILLVSRASEVVSREEIVKFLWGEDVFKDTEQGINTAIRKVRLALQDSADTPQFLQTVVGRGYRFIARIEKDEVVSSVLAPSSELTEAAKWRSLRVSVVTGGICLLAAGLIAIVLVRSKPGLPTQTLAIVSFANLGSPNDAYLAAAATDSITAAMTAYPKLHSVQVRDLASAHVLRTDLVLTGAVQKRASGFRLKAELHAGLSDSAFWAGDFDGTADDRPALQAKLAHEVSAALNLGSAQTKLNERQRVSSDPGAYDNYQRGRYYARLENEKDNGRAIEYLSEAVRTDPQFVAAYAELSRACSIRFFYYAPDDRNLEERTAIAAQKALGLGPDLPESHFAFAHLLWAPGSHFPHARAIQEYRRAIQLDPNYSEAHHQLALILLHIGSLDEGLAEARKAVDLDPSNPGARYRVGVALLYMGNFQAALDIFNATDPAFNPPLWYYQTAWAWLQLGQLAKAESYLEQFRRSSPSDPGGLMASTAAMVDAAAGRQEDAHRDITVALSRRGSFGHFHHTEYNIASAYARLGKRPEAIRWLRKAAEDGLPAASLIASDPGLRALLDSPDYATLMSEIRRLASER